MPSSSGRSPGRKDEKLGTDDDENTSHKDDPIKPNDGKENAQEGTCVLFYNGIYEIGNHFLSMKQNFTDGNRSKQSSSYNPVNGTNLDQVKAQSVAECVSSPCESYADQANLYNSRRSVRARNAVRLLSKVHRRDLELNRQNRRSNSCARRRCRCDRYSIRPIDFHRRKVKNAYQLDNCWINGFKLRDDITFLICETFIRLFEKQDSWPTLQDCLEGAAQLPPDLPLPSVDEDVSPEERVKRLHDRLLAFTGVLPPNVKDDLRHLLDNIDDLCSIFSDEDSTADLSDELRGQPEPHQY